jgi:transcriptional regulator with XRE-family HTH domain
MNKLTGKRKAKRDQAVKDFEFQHPQFSQKQIADAFGLNQATISRILSVKSPDIMTGGEGRDE